MEDVRSVAHRQTLDGPNEELMPEAPGQHDELCGVEVCLVRLRQVFVPLTRGFPEPPGLEKRPS
jgi:hypothetical protein